MRTISIQVQPDRSPGLDAEKLTSAFTEITQGTELVKHHNFSSGNDGGPYLNYTFGTPDAAALWDTIWQMLYRSSEFGMHLSRASMAMCSSENGWDQYAQLYHYDPDVPDVPTHTELP